MTARRFVITGGAGFIGSAVVRHLIENTPHRVLVVDKLTYAGNLDNLASIASTDRYKFARGDICNARDMRAIVEGFRPDVLMHLAAESHVDRSIDGPGEFIQTNVVGTFTLLEAACRYWRALRAEERAAFRFHHVSTDEVFGSLGADGLFHRGRRPSSRTRPIRRARPRPTIWCVPGTTPTGCRSCCRTARTITVPTSFPKSSFRWSSLNALEGKPVPVYGDGSNVRDWLYVEDHARALQLIAEQGRVGESYNVGGHNERTNIDVARKICALVDEFAPDRTRLARAAHYICRRPAGA